MNEKKEWQNRVLKLIDALYKRAVGRELNQFQLVERVKVSVDGKKIKN